TRSDQMVHVAGAGSGTRSPHSSARRGSGSVVVSRNASLLWSPASLAQISSSPRAVLPQTMLSPGSAVPHTMLSPTSAVLQIVPSQSAPPQSLPQPILSPSAVLPHTILSPSVVAPHTILSPSPLLLRTCWCRSASDTVSTQAGSCRPEGSEPSGRRSSYPEPPATPCRCPARRRPASSRNRTSSDLRSCNPPSCRRCASAFPSCSTRRP